MHTDTQLWTLVNALVSGFRSSSLECVANKSFAIVMPREIRKYALSKSAFESATTAKLKSSFRLFRARKTREHPFVCSGSIKARSMTRSLTFSHFSTAYICLHITEWLPEARHLCLDGTVRNQLHRGSGSLITRADSNWVNFCCFRVHMAPNGIVPSSWNSSAVFRLALNSTISSANRFYYYDFVSGDNAPSSRELCWIAFVFGVITFCTLLHRNKSCL